MNIVRDLSGALAPIPIEVYYNGTYSEDSAAIRYAGSLVCVTNIDISDGLFYTFAGSAGTTAMENVCGILAEQQAASGNYLPSDADYGMVLKKMFPLLPTSVVRAEYMRADDAAAANYDTGATCTAASTAFTITSVEDRCNGGWVYMINGAEGGYLHYVENSTSTTSLTLATAANNAIVGADDFLLIEPAAASVLDFNATYTGIKSEAAAGGEIVTGIMHYIEAPGIPFQRLDRNKHDNLYVGTKARFYHDFCIPYKNAWTTGITAA